MTIRSKFPIPSFQIEQFTLNIPDLPDFIGFSDEFEKQFQSQFKKIGNEAKEFWKSEAGRRLTRARDSYQASIVSTVDSNGIIHIRLGGKGGNATKKDRWLSNAIESGTPAYDLKPGFLKGGLKSRVIPLDTKYEGRIYRTVKATGHENKWIHPGFKGLHLVDYVITEVNNNIIPKYINIAYNKALAKFK